MSINMVSRPAIPKDYHKIVDNLFGRHTFVGGQLN